MMHSAVPLRTQVAELQAANEATTRRRSHKRKQIQKEGTLKIEEGARLTALKAFGAHSDGKKSKKRARTNEDEQTQRRCGRCHETGHSIRTCKSNVETIVE